MSKGKGVRFEKLVMDGIEAETSVPESVESNGIIMYIHDGYMLSCILPHSRIIDMPGIMDRSYYEIMGIIKIM